MALPIPMPVVISAVKALIRFRGRVDEILALREAAADLPFALPPAPVRNTPHRADMLAFFATDTGAAILELKGLRDDFDTVSADPASPQVQGPRDRLFALYYEAAEVRPIELAPNVSEAQFAGTGPSPELRLAYYVVESDRLSRNPALTRILLATADTLLEFAGENAGLFIGNPRTRVLVETLIDEFAGKRDFDDDSAERIVRTLLGSAVVAVSEHPGQLAEEPALKHLLAAIATVRDEQGDDFVANLISRDGFQRVVGSYLVHVADDPAFLTADQTAQDVLSSMLRELGDNLPQIVEDPRAFAGVLEVGLATAASHVDTLLLPKVQGKPLLTLVLSAVAEEVEKRGLANQLFATIGNGDLVASLYRTVLEGIAASPDVLGNRIGADEFASTFVAELADALADVELTDLLTPSTLQLVVTESLEQLSLHPELVGQDAGFAARIVGATVAAAAEALADGPNRDDFFAIVDAAIETAAANLALIEMDEHLAAILGTVGGVLAGEGTARLLNAQGRKDALIAALDAVAANPVIWRDFAEQDLVRPVMTAVARALESGGSDLLTGPVYVDALRTLLAGIARRGRGLLDGTVDPDLIQRVLQEAIKRAEEELGRSVDGENIVGFLNRVLRQFLSAPFDLAPPGARAKLEEILDKALDFLEAA